MLANGYNVDPRRAAEEGPFGRTVAHGYLTLGLATPFVTQLLDVRGPVLGINYGLDRVRFAAALPVGERVRARGRLAQAEQVGANILVRIDLDYESEGASKRPCTAQVLSLLCPTQP